MRFTRRTGWDLRPNLLARKREELREKGIPVLDLTVSNPTQVGIQYPKELLNPLAHPRGLLYEPDPKGLLSAREAVASLFRAKGVCLDPEQIVLTASTSEAFGYLFRLLADPGDELLVPRPSYPLFDYLADLQDVRPVPYRLRPALPGRWELDLEALAGTASARSRAFIAVQPNNPTGSCFNQTERQEVFRFCRRRELALISDEVFAEYLFQKEPETAGTLLGLDPAVLTFSLGGLSKWMGLPQMKLAWIAVEGPKLQRDEALSRLEMMADTFLSVNTAVQMALPEWIELAGPIQAQILQRLRVNRQELEGLCRDGPIRLFPSQGGWTAVLQMGSVPDEEAWAAALLEERQVLVHPGYLFGFEMDGVVVVSLLPSPKTFAEGIRSLLDYAAA